MTRKDYVNMAMNLRFAVEQSEGAEQMGVAFAIRALADALRCDNERFDRKRFYLACGLNESGRLV